MSHTKNKEDSCIRSGGERCVLGAAIMELKGVNECTLGERRADHSAWFLFGEIGSMHIDGKVLQCVGISKSYVIVLSE